MLDIEFAYEKIVFLEVTVLRSDGCLSCPLHETVGFESNPWRRQLALPVNTQGMAEEAYISRAARL